MKVKAKNSRSRSRQNFRISSTRARRSWDLAKNTVLTSIAIVMLLVLVYVIFSLIATPEFLIKREIESIAADYYENYFYESNEFSDSADSTLEKYSTTGLPRITLNQLLLYDNRKHYASASTISKYCDLNKTIVKIFPEPPYTSKNYRVEYNYSCNF